MEMWYGFPPLITCTRLGKSRPSAVLNMVLVPSSFNSMRSTGISVGRQDFPFTSFRSCGDKVSGSVTTTVSLALLGLPVRLLGDGHAVAAAEVDAEEVDDDVDAEGVGAVIEPLPPAAFSVVATLFVVCVTVVDGVMLIRSGGSELIVFFSSEAPASTTNAVMLAEVVGTRGGGEGSVAGEGVIVTGGCCDFGFCVIVIGALLSCCNSVRFSCETELSNAIKRVCTDSEYVAALLLAFFERTRSPLRKYFSSSTR